MKSISGIKEINKIIRNALIKQSGLSSNNVLNALSLHGEDLDKKLSKQYYGSYETNESVLLFELNSRQSTSNTSFTDDDDKIVYYRSFTVSVTLYGDDSSDIASNIVARLRTADSKLALYSDGIYLEAVSEPTTLNEYKNETMWIRNDIELSLSCYLSIEQVEPSQPFDSTTIIIKEQ